MFKVVYLLERRKDLDDAAFWEHWRRVHVPLVEQLPGLVKYIVEPVTGSPDQEPPEFQGMAELYYRDRASFDHAQSSPEMAAALSDTPNFTERVTAAFVDEHLLRDLSERAST